MLFWVCPVWGGGTRSGQYQGHRNVSRSGEDPGHVEAAKEVDDMLLAKFPMGRFGVPDEITDGLIFACSDMASFMSGCTLVCLCGKIRTLADKVGFKKSMAGMAAV